MLINPINTAHFQVKKKLHLVFTIPNMGSLSRQASSDVESGINRKNHSDVEEEQQVKPMKTALGVLSSLSLPAAIGIAKYEGSRSTQNRIARGLLYASTSFMALGFIFALILFILAHVIRGRQGFDERLKHGVIFVTVLVAMAVVLVVVATFF